MIEKNVIKDIFVQIIAAIAVQIIFLGCGYIYLSLHKEELSIIVCSSTYNELGYYNTSVNVHNYQDNKSIDSIIIWNQSGVDETNINYDDVEYYDNRIVLKNIPPKYNETIILKSEKEITEDNTKIETLEKSVVKYICNQKEEIDILKLDNILLALWYILFFSIMTIIVNIHENEIAKERNAKIAQLEKRCDSIDNEIEYEEKRIREYKNTHVKIKLLMQRRIIDYANELRFYKLLLRDLIKDKNDVEGFYLKVTKALKTYRTLEKINPEDVDIDFFELSEEEKDELL